MRVASATLLVYCELNRPSALVANVSNVAVVAVLEQRQGIRWLSLTYFQRKNSKAERNYGTNSASFSRQHLLKGTRFIIKTDHKPLVYVMCSFKSRTNQLIRHLSYISQFGAIHSFQHPDQSSLTTCEGGFSTFFIGVLWSLFQLPSNFEEIIMA